MRAEPKPRAGLLTWALAYAPAASLAVLLPKCPFCIAAPLALIGVAIPIPSEARTLIVVVSVVLGTAWLSRRYKRSNLGAQCPCVPRRVDPAQ